MFWNSVPFMTTVDILILGIIGYSLIGFRRPAIFVETSMGRAAYLSVYFGLGLIALFYFADLATMHVFPVFMARGEAMNIMSDLHLNHRWLISLIAVGCISLGYRSTVNANTNLAEEARKEAEARRLAEARYRRLSDNTVEGVIVTESGRITDANLAAADLLGYTEEELTKLDVMAIVAPEAEEMVRQRVAGNFEGHYESVGLRKDGTTFPAEINVQISEENGRLLRMVCFRDLTEIRRTHEALRESEAKLNAFFENAPVGLATYDDHFRFTKINETLARINGIPAEEHIGRTIADVLPALAQPLITSYREILETGKPQLNTEFTAKLPGMAGDEQHWLSSRFPIPGQDGKPEGIGAVVLDITERKRAEVALRESEAQLRVVTDALPVLISYVDAGHRYRHVNKAYEEWFGHSRDWVNGRHVREVLGDAAYESLRGYIERALSGKTVSYEDTIPYEKGGKRHIHAIYVPDIGENGEVKGFFVSVTDITERKRAEDELQKLNEGLEQRIDERTAELHAAQRELVTKERLAALGQLSATVSHELRNPLGTIRIALDLVEMKTRGMDLGIEPAVERMDRNITRCNQIIEEMLDYARTLKIERKPMPVCAWLDEVLDKLKTPTDITVRRELPTPGPVLELDPERLRRAVINVHDNACQAMTEEGIKKSRGKVLTVSTRKAGGRFEVCFSDTGPGMAPEVLANVFEPLYSTKSFGVGLGLPIVKQIMEQHGGGIDIASTEKQGTEVVLWLPLAEGGNAH